MTFKHRLRLRGSLIIMAAAVGILNFEIPESLYAPSYNPTSFNAAKQTAQKQSLEEIKDRALILTATDGKSLYLYKTGRGLFKTITESRGYTNDRLHCLDENNKPILGDYEGSNIESLAIVPESIPPSWIHPEGPIS